MIGQMDHRGMKVMVVGEAEEDMAEEAVVSEVVEAASGAVSEVVEAAAMGVDGDNPFIVSSKAFWYLEW